MSKLKDRNDLIWDEFAEICKEAEIDDADLMDAIVLDWLRKTHGPGDGGKLMQQLKLFRAGQADIPKFKQHSAAPAEVFAGEVPAGRVVDQRLEKDRTNTRK